MRINQALAAACLISLLGGGLPAFGDETRFNGHFWQQSDASTRRLFVYSLSRR